jgi:hypothetical protein
VLALRMKALGFDEKTFKEYDTSGTLQQVGLLESHGLEYILAPTWQSVFRCFRDKYQIDSWIYPNLNGFILSINC